MFARAIIYSLPGKNYTNAIEIWNGNPDIAQVVNQAERWSKKHATEKMFDFNPNTCWHSAKHYKDAVKIIGVRFHVSYQYQTNKD